MARMLIQRFLVTISLCMLISVSALAQDTALQLRQQKLEQARDHYEAGKKLIQEGNFSDANSEFNKVELLLQEAQITQEPVPSETAELPDTTLQGQTQKKQVEKALQFYISELKKETSNPDYYYNLGIEYLKNGQFVMAEEAFKLVINLNPLDKDACFNLGILYENYLGNKEKALKYYQQYLNIAPDAPDAPQVQQWINEITEGKIR